MLDFTTDRLLEVEGLIFAALSFLDTEELVWTCYGGFKLKYLFAEPGNISIYGSVGKEFATKIRSPCGNSWLPDTPTAWKKLNYWSRTLIKWVPNKQK